MLGSAAIYFNYSVLFRALFMIVPLHASSLRHSALSAVSLNALCKPTKREVGSIFLWSY